MKPKETRALFPLEVKCDKCGRVYRRCSVQVCIKNSVTQNHYKTSCHSCCARCRHNVFKGTFQMCQLLIDLKAKV